VHDHLLLRASAPLRENLDLAAIVGITVDRREQISDTPPMQSLRPTRVASLALLLCALPACRVSDWQLWHAAEQPAGACQVEQIRDVRYYDGPHADAVRHKLDIYLPKGRKDFPVVMLVHGGAWMVGDNRCCGLYPSVGEYLASQGIAAVLPNYRLSPGVRHPEHVKDVARAFAWARAHIGRYGGDPNQIFLLRHSPGGHLVSPLS